jgi:acetyltransferase-like isoleucine patch superfamily enzyme
MLIGNPKFIRIGKGVVIQEGVRLEAVIVDPANPPAIFIGDGVNIEQNVSISAVGKIYIGNHVGIGARSTIIGSSHPFFDVHDPTKISARIGGVGSVTEIGDYCFMGVNDVIQMNVKLGKYVVVGANTVVKSNVTDYSVVEGNPAAVILTYNKEEDRWVRPAKKS